jgi:hypothetical protein
MATSETATDPAVPLEAGAVEALASTFRGRLIRRGARTYDEEATAFPATRCATAGWSSISVA